MKFEIACSKSRDEMRVDTDDDSVWLGCEEAYGERASIFIEDKREVEKLRDALNEWLERNA